MKKLAILACSILALSACQNESQQQKAEPKEPPPPHQPPPTAAKKSTPSCPNLIPSPSSCATPKVQVVQQGLNTTY